MDTEQLLTLFECVAAGTMEPNAAVAAAGRIGITDLGFAQIDHHRHLRCGWPEVVYGAGKTVEQIERIVDQLMTHEGAALVTRLPADASSRLATHYPDGIEDKDAATFALRRTPIRERSERVSIVTAGTSDQRVAAEALATLRFFGFRPHLIWDAGVAGIARILQRQEELRRSCVAIVVAGMDGALPSVVGGLIAAPVIAVPTSVGYGASFGGVTAMLTMLTSCASGVTVVNIDNGFGAAIAALRIVDAQHHAGGGIASSSNTG